jgi:mRNA-degrading endonuclease RelE of RelBE toxin-antitoxin system
MKIIQTPTFARQIKKLHANQKKDLDDAIKEIAKDPTIGESKKGDLATVRVYKFKMTKQLTLVAYEWHQDTLQLVILLAFGSHENFYRDLKK